MAHLDAAQGDDPAPAGGTQICRRHAAGGLDNPLGARTLYLYKNGVYTVFTIYSTSDAESIGTNVTSGCTGLLSQDMIDLYSRTPIKTKVVMLPA